MVILPPRLFPSAGYYRQILNSTRVCVDIGARYDKRCKAVHRYDIVDARGPLSLTVPMCKPHGMEGAATWADVAVSVHDRWWQRHIVALESAYGRTPYFEFIIDRFDRVFRSPHHWENEPSAIDIIREANKAVFSVLSLDDPVDYRRVELSAYTPIEEISEPYWQVRQHIHGFTGGLSVLDLLFNLGPEAWWYLKNENTH